MSKTNGKASGKPSLTVSGFTLTSTGLEVTGKVAFEQWQEVGDWLRHCEGAVHWWIGDWLNYGERHYGEMYTQALETTGFEYQTLADDRWVAERIEFSRRRENLPFAHHREVAALEPGDQDALLDEAEREGLTREKLRRRVAEYRQEKADRERLAALDESDFIPDVRCCSMQDLLSAIDGVDAIITDPPYPEEFLPLYGELARLAKRSLRKGGILAVMCGQSYLPAILADMAAQIEYRWTIGYLTPGGQAVQVWPRKVNTFWKPVLLFGGSEGWIGDVVQSDVNDNDKRFHEWGQSESGMLDLVERLTRPGHLVCDPFLGAGTTGVACTLLGRRFIGCDISKTHVETAAARIRAAAQSSKGVPLERARANGVA